MPLDKTDITFVIKDGVVLEIMVADHFVDRVDGRKHRSREVKEVTLAQAKALLPAKAASSAEIALLKKERDDLVVDRENKAAEIAQKTSELETVRKELQEGLDPPIRRHAGDIARWMNTKGKGAEALKWLKDNPDVAEFNVKDATFVQHMTNLNLDPTELHPE